MEWEKAVEKTKGKNGDLTGITNSMNVSLLLDSDDWPSSMDRWSASWWARTDTLIIHELIQVLPYEGHRDEVPEGGYQWSPCGS